MPGAALPTGTRGSQPHPAGHARGNQGKTQHIVTFLVQTEENIDSGEGAIAKTTIRNLIYAILSL